MKRKLTVFLSTVAAIYLLLCVGLYFFQEVLLFPGVWRNGGIVQAPRGVELDHLATDGGLRFRVARGKPDGEVRGVLVFFVGNGEDLHSAVRRAQDFARYGLETLVPEYPGYGESEGKASFDTVMAAAEASVVRGQEMAEARGVPLFIAGQSLGSFPALHVAALGYGQKLLIASPPSSVAAVGQSRYPFLPVRPLIRHPFDNLANAPAVKIPTMVIHGDADDTVPFAMGQAVAAAIPGAELRVARGGGHNDLSLHRGGPHGAAIEQHLFR
jgi:pimeloyl-ACP methyl ester carboxylesterase